MEEAGPRPGSREEKGKFWMEPGRVDVSPGSTTVTGGMTCASWGHSEPQFFLNAKRRYNLPIGSLRFVEKCKAPVINGVLRKGA